MDSTHRVNFATGGTSQLLSCFAYGVLEYRGSHAPLQNIFSDGKGGRTMHRFRRPAAYGFAVAVGTVIGFAVLGGSSIESGLTVAVSAFVVMFVLKLLFDR